MSEEDRRADMVMDLEHAIEVGEAWRNSLVSVRKALGIDPNRGDGLAAVEALKAHVEELEAGLALADFDLGPSASARAVHLIRHRDESRSGMWQVSFEWGAVCSSPLPLAKALAMAEREGCDAASIQAIRLALGVASPGSLVIDEEPVDPDLAAHNINRVG